MQQSASIISVAALGGMVTVSGLCIILALRVFGSHSMTASQTNTAFVFRLSLLRMVMGFMGAAASISIISSLLSLLGGAVVVSIIQGVTALPGTCRGSVVICLQRRNGIYLTIAAICFGIAELGIFAAAASFLVPYFFSPCTAALSAEGACSEYLSENYARNE